MDIKMPGIDGVTAVKEILPILPNTKCIMVTAFDTFQYAQEVMKYGIKEYLLKPSKKGTILEALDRMLGEIHEEKKQEADKQELTHRLERMGSLVESEFIVSLMMDYVNEFNTDDWRQYLDMEGEHGFVVVFSFESSNLLSNRLEKTEWYRKLKQLLQENYEHCLVGPLMGFQVPTFFLIEEGKNDPKEEGIRSILQLFQKKCTRLPAICRNWYGCLGIKAVFSIIQRGHLCP